MILTERPELLFEGMAVAGYAVGAEEGIVYLRGEYAYLQRHLDQLMLVRRWAESGLSLDRIRELRSGAAEEPPPRRVRPGTVEVWSRVTLADGLELQVEPGRAGLSPEQLRLLVREVTAAYRRVRGDHDAADGAQGEDGQAD